VSAYQFPTRSSLTGTTYAPHTAAVNCVSWFSTLPRRTIFAGKSYGAVLLYDERRSFGSYVTVPVSNVDGLRAITQPPDSAPFHSPTVNLKNRSPSFREKSITVAPFSRYRKRNCRKLSVPFILNIQNESIASTTRAVNRDPQLTRYRTQQSVRTYSVRRKR